jgi:peptide/nickel transport system substrate-binding protein
MALFGVVALAAAAAVAAQAPAGEDVVVATPPGVRGGSLTVAQRAEPRTFNPLLASDGPSREIVQRLHASLIRIDRSTLRTEPELARRWDVSADGRTFTIHLRRHLRFSDGEPFDADDVVFSLQAYLDEAVGSPQRDLLIVGGRPITVARIDAWTVRIGLAEPYAAAERLFDGLAMLPQQRLAPLAAAGGLAKIWTTATAPDQIAGLGPYRLASRSAGERVVLERNPYYWKVDRAGTRLPYLDRLVFLAVTSEDAQVARFQAGETDAISRVGAEAFALLDRASSSAPFRMQDLGPGLEYAFLFVNQNDVPVDAPALTAARRRWFRDLRFRQAISAAIDRAGIVKLAFQGRATPLWGHVTPGHGHWANVSIATPPRSLDRARALLAAAGFRRAAGGPLVDAAGTEVRFTIVTNATNVPRVRMATIIQDDLSALGITAQVVPLEFRALIERLTRTFDYDACVLSLGGADADPNTEINVWLSSGANHLWRPAQPAPATAWEAEIDGLMRRQLVERDPARRKALYDRVQAIVAEQLPIVPLAAPNVLVGMKRGLAGVRPSIVEPALLWNVEEIWWRR